MARKLQVEGTVILRVLVNERGQSEVVEILRDTKRKVGLAESSRDAIGRWTWTPAMKNGKKVKTWITVAVPFVIR
jgi:TonB family protein